jgi:vancomycin resistance protein VanW
MILLNIFKHQIKILQKTSIDIITLDYFKFAQKEKEKYDFKHCTELTQEIKQNETFGSKIYNFNIASKKINKIVIEPNEIFSFWHTIGNPKNQFQKGRTIKEGKIFEDIGGGLCQVSGILYYISIIAGLKVLERHNHSVDIYDDSTRFCPLGTDSTLVHGYKDLRIQNNYNFPIKFNLSVLENTINVKLLSTKKIEESELSFETKEIDNFKTVSVFDSNGIKINESKYKKLNLTTVLRNLG